mmetsp:Transcript_14577/g.46320  ORF Transcript_14577/g.46320 Transcript_14577/m.46320 type:complete len:236 (+) Transcript_14577:98-805(+)
MGASDEIADEVGDVSFGAPSPRGEPVASSSTIADEVGEATGGAGAPLRAAASEGGGSEVSSEYPSEAGTTVSAFTREMTARFIHDAEKRMLKQEARIKDDLGDAEARSRARLRKMWSSRGASETEGQRDPSRKERMVMMQMAADEADAERQLAGNRADFMRQKLFFEQAHSMHKLKAIVGPGGGGAEESGDIHTSGRGRSRDFTGITYSRFFVRNGSSPPPRNRDFTGISTVSSY